MMSSIERWTHLAILCLCLTVSAVLIKKHFLAPASPSLGIASGETLTLPEEAALASAEKTLIIALSPDCRFCTESMPFYRQLIDSRSAGGSDFRVVAVVGDRDRMWPEQRILQAAGVEVDTMVSADFQSIGIVGTPTLVLVDRRGEALDVWQGKLDEKRQARVRRALAAPGKATS